jgi:hypothetical protein
MVITNNEFLVATSTDAGVLSAVFVNPRDSLDRFYISRGIDPRNESEVIDLLRREMAGYSEHFSGSPESYLDALEQSFLSELVRIRPRLPEQTLLECIGALSLSEHSPSP